MAPSIILVFELHLCKGCGPVHFFSSSSPLDGAWIKAEVFVNWKRLVLIVFHKSLLFTKVTLEMERIIKVHSYCSFFKVMDLGTG